MTKRRVRVWDLPTRLFHWLLVIAIAGAYATGETGGNWLVWHGRLGLFIVGLVAFRLVWGLIGSTYARFSSFFPTPAAIKAYLGGRWQGLGHNPLGALSVFGLLGLVGLQGFTGLFAFNDDIGYEGPLYALLQGSTGSQFTTLHHQIFNGLMAVVALHVAAILFYAHVKKQNLVKPMVTGNAEAAEGTAGEPARGGGPVAFLAALLIALGVVAGASGVWLSKPPPPPPAAAQDW